MSLKLLFSVSFIDLHIDIHKPLSAIIGSHSNIHHPFADDLQLQMSATPDRIS